MGPRANRQVFPFLLFLLESSVTEKNNLFTLIIKMFFVYARAIITTSTLYQFRVSIELQGHDFKPISACIFFGQFSTQFYKKLDRRIILYILG